MRIKTKEDRRDRIKYRIRKRMTGTTQKPRLSVFRSVAHIYVQVIDDMSGQTIASAPAVLPPRTLPLKTFFNPGSVLAAAATVRPAMSSITCA